MILFFALLLGACLISGALTIDEFHNWDDVLAGAIKGNMYRSHCFPPNIRFHFRLQVQPLAPAACYIPLPSPAIFTQRLAWTVFHLPTFARNCLLRPTFYSRRRLG
ncbi:hypothetical protein CPB84DRAFT_1763386 [Gymnopilus junonius]|uniref:Secreted protein n=1 Tax=Gymnopilus junonius TaxID=109634 RepID=A0A9P5P099_GYMJU|nr:hypothetical protein CPB84DRAFT_1763386 [Gymnopilus junonius]